MHIEYWCRTIGVSHLSAQRWKIVMHAADNNERQPYTYRTDGTVPKIYLLSPYHMNTIQATRKCPIIAVIDWKSVHNMTQKLTHLTAKKYCKTCLKVKKRIVRSVYHQACMSIMLNLRSINSATCIKQVKDDVKYRFMTVRENVSS